MPLPPLWLECWANLGYKIAGMTFVPLMVIIAVLFALDIVSRFKTKEDRSEGP